MMFSRYFRALTIVSLVFCIILQYCDCKSLYADESLGADEVVQQPVVEPTAPDSVATESPIESPQEVSDQADSDAENAAGSARADDSGRPSAEVVAALQAGPRALSLAFRMAAKRATGSVVVLEVYGQNSKPEENEQEAVEDELPLLERAEIPEPPPSPENQKLTGLGSGVIISKDGLILTNNHVIKGAKRVQVKLPDGTPIDADVIVGDPDSDVAIVRIKTPETLQPIEMGDSDKLEIGDWVLAIGSPFNLEATVSAGIISGKNRTIDRIPRSNMLQTDAAINPGNSGGALIDLDGNVIGISTAIATRSGFYQGVGFAIPINQARWIASELDKHGQVRRAAIGTTLVDLKPRIAKKFNLEPNSGILIYQVIKGSVAEDAGLKPGDVIVEFSGRRVRDSATLQAEIERKPIGSTQPVLVERGGKRIQLQVELATVDNPRSQKDD